MPETNQIPTNVKIAYLMGRQNAIEIICQKLNQQVLMIQEEIKKLRDEENKTG